MKSTIRIFLAIAFCFLCTSVQAAGVVKDVQVHLEIKGAAPPPQVYQRMVDSIHKVGEALLIAKDDDPDPELRDLYSKTVRQVFDRVLLGYSVEEADVKIGPVSLVEVTLRPWGEVVQKVKVEWDYGDTAPTVLPLLKHDLEGLDQTICNSLVGLPIESLDWASAMNKVFWLDQLSLQLPEYRPHIEIKPGTECIVKISLQPVGATIKEVKLEVRSANLPSLVLYELKSPLKEASQQLYHLPVAFAARHSQDFEQLFQKTAAQQSIAQKYGLTLTAQLEPASQTVLTVTGETSKYRLFMEGYLDFGREKDNTSVKLHVGQQVKPKDEVFFETTFVPASVAWHWSVGYSRTLQPNLTAGLRHSLSDQNNTLFLNYAITPLYSLRLERDQPSGVKEVALRYRLHDFLSAEYIVRDRENWLRLIGTL